MKSPNMICEKPSALSAIFLGHQFHKTDRASLELEVLLEELLRRSGFLAQEGSGGHLIFPKSHYLLP